MDYIDGHKIAFRALKLTKNADVYKYSYPRYGIRFDSR